MFGSQILDRGYRANYLLSSKHLFWGPECRASFGSVLEGAIRIALLNMDYTVQNGDCMSSIGFENGFFWKTLWNLPENAALKAKRKNPNVLLAGDIVFIPDLRVKQVPGAPMATHKFMLKGAPEKLNITLLDFDHKPRPNLDYVIVIEGIAKRGTTDGSGKVTEPIPPNAKTGKLTFAAPQPLDGTGQPLPGKPKNQVMILQLGSLDPISEVSGIKARLANLGFYKGPIDGNLDVATQNAISLFQSRKGLEVTGTASDATVQKLQAIHGH